MAVKDFVKELKKRFGSQLALVSDIKDIRIPTGIFNLDFELGGGIRHGTFTLLAGKYQGGKSLTAMRICKNAQHMDRETFVPLKNEGGVYVKADGSEGSPMRILYLDTEGTFDYEWAKTIGLNTDESIFLRLLPESLESTYDILHGGVKCGEFDVIVLDSIAAMASEKELEASLSDAQMGVAARGNNRGIRVTHMLMNAAHRERGTAPSIILVNQLRDSLDLYSAPVYPGGHGQNFASSLTIEFRPTKPVVVDDTVVARGSIWKIAKNKINGITGASGEFLTYITDTPPYRRGETNYIPQLVKVATRTGVLDRRGAWYELDGQSLQGEAQVVEYLTDFPESLERLKAAVFERTANEPR